LKRDYDCAGADNMKTLITFPEIRTENLLLRRMSHKDIPDIFEMRNNPKMIGFTDGKIDGSYDETKVYIDMMSKGIDENKWIIWAIEHKATHKVIGSISIWNIDDEKMNGELGYGVIPDYHGKGLMKEALLIIVEFGFIELDLNEIFAYTEENNLSSIRLLEKCNFKEVERIEEEGFYKKEIFNMVVYSMKR